MSYSDLNYGDRLRSIRKHLGYTTTEVAEAINISQSYLSAFENKRRTPDLDMLEKILNFYGVSFAEFFEDDSELPLDLRQLLRSAKQLSPDERFALNNFLTTLTNRKEDVKNLSNDKRPAVERLAAHLEGEYGVHDQAFVEEVYSLIQRAQALSDEEG